MIELGRPAVAMAGALLALLPIALHFLSRRPPVTAPLPTARFLAPERLIRVHLERYPTDLLHLALRVLLILTLSTAFAEPYWAARGSGTADVVLLDGSLAMAPHWAEAIDSVRAILGTSTSNDGSGRPAGAPPQFEALPAGRATVIVFDSIARRVSVDGAAFDSLASARPGGALGGAVPVPPDPPSRGSAESSTTRQLLPPTPPADLAVALSALRTTAQSLPADSVRAWIISSALRGSWRPALAELRQSAWPGEIGVIAFAPPVTPILPAEPARFAAAAVFAATDAERALLTAAIEAFGLPAVPLDTTAPLGETAVLAFTATPSPDDLKAALDAGATVVLGPATHAAVAGLEPIWTPDEGGAPRPHPLVRFQDGFILRGASVIPGTAAPEALWLAATGDGEPVALAARSGPGCLVTAAFDPVSLVPVAAAAVPEVLGRLLNACGAVAPRPDAALALDLGALSILARGVAGSEGSDGLDATPGTASENGPGRAPRPVALDLLRVQGADPWMVRALLFLALTLACVEAYLSYGRSQGNRIADQV